MEEKIRTYPNPATNFIFIEISNMSANNLTFKIIDRSGNTLKSIQKRHANSTFAINISDLVSGEYILEVSNLKDSTSRSIKKK